MKDIIQELLVQIDSLREIVKKNSHTSEDRTAMIKLSDEIKTHVAMLSSERIEKLNRVKNILLSNDKNLEFDIHMEEDNAQMRIDKIKGWPVKHHINQAIITVNTNNDILMHRGPEIDSKIEEILNQSIESIFGKKPTIPQGQRIN